MPLFQSNLRKQIRQLQKILNFVKIIHYYSKLFTGVLNDRRGDASAGREGVAEGEGRAGEAAEGVEVKALPAGHAGTEHAVGGDDEHDGDARVRGAARPVEQQPGGLRSEVNSELNFCPNFEGLVLGCIDADFCK